MNKHILLISYTFPPYPGIGGRRWAKFAKYLTKNDYIVHVIHAKNPFDSTSLWLNDIEFNNQIIRYEVNSRYPKSLLITPKSLAEKIKYRLSLIMVNLFTKGTPYDRGVFCKKEIHNLSKKIIESNNIKNVIVSCAPFSSAYHTLELKKEINDLNILVDFRDPWTWGTAYGFGNLNNSRLIFEKQMEKYVIENSDRILVPSIEMKNHLDVTYAKYTDKVHLLSHGFDEDEISIEPKIKSDKIRLMFYGSIYENLNSVFDSIEILLNNMNGKITLDIYSTLSPSKQLPDSVKLKHKLINYYDSVLPEKLFKNINTYDYILIIQPDYAKDFITTKIYEIIYSQTPIILIANPGKLSNFILDNNLGLWISPSNLNDGMESLLDINPQRFKLQQFPIHNYSFPSITSELTLHFK